MNTIYYFIRKIYRYGIELAGVSADGDPRLLAAMEHENGLDNGIKVTQDITHTCGKVRNRLLKPDIHLPIGTYKISIDHLRAIVNDVQKSVHGLTFGDIYPTDRMNYHSFAKVVKDRVIETLRSKIPNSEGTVRYLLTFRDIAESFSNYDLKPLERLFLIYRSLFFLRIWRMFITNSREYNLTNNFITRNTYMCVELNAKNLLYLMKEFRDRDGHDLFLPALFDSQTCERTFRIFRSMGTTQFTKINFSLHELIGLICRLEAMHDISYCKLNIHGIKMPHTRKEKTTNYQLPTDVEIDNTIAKAKYEAIQIAASLGITTPDPREIDECKAKSHPISELANESCDFDEDDEATGEEYKHKYAKYELEEDMEEDMCLNPVNQKEFK